MDYQKSSRSSSISDLTTPICWDILISMLHELHPHCFNCINLYCNALPPVCSMIKCKLDCGARFHACKLNEHDLMCANVQVKCINAEFGCSLTMPRRNQAVHLQYCPASVVVCSAEWGRIPKEEKDIVPLCANHLDSTFAFRDQKYLTSALFQSDIKCTYPLQTKIVNYITAHKKRLELINDTLAVNPDPTKPWPLLVNRTIEFGTRFHSRVANKYVFTCGEELRRDMYPWHFKNVHNDILCSLNGWMDHHCPLESLKCNFSNRRLYPDTPNATLIYDNDMECFAVCYKDENLEAACVDNEDKISSCNSQLLTSNANVKAQDPGEKPSLCNLPTEVLELLFNYLDPLSLANISLTCHRLRDVCASMFLPLQGIVCLKWQREENLTHLSEAWQKTRWKVLCNVWKFPKFFTPIRKWGHHDYSPMAHHMNGCDKYVRHVTTTSYNLSTGIGPQHDIL